MLRSFKNCLETAGYFYHLVFLEGFAACDSWIYKSVGGNLEGEAVV